MNRRNFLCGVVAVIISPSLPEPIVKTGVRGDCASKIIIDEREYHRLRVGKILKSIDSDWCEPMWDRMRHNTMVSYWHSKLAFRYHAHLYVAFDLYQELKKQVNADSYRALVEVRVREAMQQAAFNPHKSMPWINYCGDYTPQAAEHFNNMRRAYQWPNLKKS